MRTQDTTGVKSALRVLDLLELFSSTSTELKLSEVARQLNMPKSSTFALLNTLISRGYVEDSPAGYRLAERYRISGWVGGPYARLLRVAHPIMVELSGLIRESVFIGALNGRNMVQYLDKVISDEPLRYDADLSKERYAYATTIGQVLLADWPQEQLEQYLTSQPLTQVTPKTEIDLVRLREQLARVRELGYAELSDTHKLGVSGISAPIRGESNRVAAGLCTFGPTQRMMESWDSHRTQVLRAAGRISASLQAG
ncbi:MAG: IclR family transcriptional regulator [Alcaligenaceae bacterium]|nr:IclR family transcriptional regulator [Alcaligenaceae bacterium]